MIFVLRYIPGEQERLMQEQQQRLAVAGLMVFPPPLLIQGVFFHWYPPKKLKYGKPRLGESTLT